MVWIVETYRDAQYVGMAISWAFKSKDAAEWWIANRADKSLGFRYYASQLPVYSLEDIQSFTA